MKKYGESKEELIKILRAEGLTKKEIEEELQRCR